MKLVDTNVLLHAVNADSPEHAVARACLEEGLSEHAGIGFAWLALIGFVRLATRRGILARPLAAEDALAVVDDWLAAANARLLEATPRHWPILRRLLVGAGSAGNLANDVHLAALAIEHGAVLVSFDRDFERFSGLRFELLPG
ncbi:MAG: ribonuclease VapC37 [Pseudomonadota bacterium]|nr:type II toxin-antitoxin system VapC family toxin [Rubrivivax sp.]NLZ40062.1 type II toxin-antitoxin system VapC family toxin [Comamonadaceae bacterium]